MSDFAARLAALDNDFDSTEALGGMHPEGKYTGEIKTARIEESEKAGDDTLNLVLHYKTEKGMAFGRIRLTNHPSEASMGFAKGQLANLGHVGKLSQVPEILPSLIGAFADIVVEHNEWEGNTYANTTVRKLTSAPVGAQAGFNAFAQAPAQVDPATAQAFDMAGVPAAPAPAPAQAPAFDPAHAAPMAAPVAPQSPSQAIAAAPVAPSNLPFG